MPADLVLGIDCSTTACKAVAWNAEGVPVAESRAPLALLTPQPGRAEQDARQWWEVTAHVLREATARIAPERIAAICITHQRETFVPVDNDGFPLRNAILWSDERSRTQLAALDQRIGHAALHDLSGRPPSMTQSLPKLVWLVEQEPDVARAAARIVDVHAYLVHALTGEWVTSLACADPMGVVDMRRGAWATDLIRAIGLREDQFVPITASGAVIGGVTVEAAAATGLSVRHASRRRGRRWSGGQPRRGHHRAGPGLREPWHRHRRRRRERPLHDGSRLSHLRRRYSGHVRPRVRVARGTATVTWFMEHIADPRHGHDAFTIYERDATELPRGAAGLMLVPYWNTVMNPYWDPAASGLVLGWTTAHRRHHLYRAILEGIAFEHRLAVEGIVTATGIPLEEHVILGGGSRSPLWCQIMADVLAAPVVRARSADATNLGAGMLAAWAAGWFPSLPDAAAAMTATTERFAPDAEGAGAYDRLYREIYVHLFPALRPYMDRLTELSASPSAQDAGDASPAS